MCVFSVSNILYKSIILQRFWDRVVVGEEDECWLWTAGKQKDGYGSIRIIRKSDGESVKVQAHRLSYMIHIGDILPGILVLHSCDNPPCCNPKHLWSGTSHDNMQDKYNKGRSGHTPESLSALKTIWKGRKHSQETKVMMSESATKRWERERNEISNH